MSLPLALEAVLQQLIRLESPLVPLLQPGLSRKAIDDMVRPFPFKLSEDLYQLYMWRNGTEEGSGTENSYGGTDLFAHPAAHFAPLATTLDASVELSEHLNTDELKQTWGTLEFEPSPYYFDLFSDPGDSDFLVPCGTASLEKPLVLFWSPELGEPRIHYSDLESMMWTIAACYESGAYFLRNAFENEPLYPEVDYEKERQIARQFNPSVSYWQENP